jgi:hypothetical protein
VKTGVGHRRPARVRRALPLVAAAWALLAPSVASGHSANPFYLSQVTSVTPLRHGVRVEVLDRDDRLAITNRSGEAITILGYEGEPYARIAPDGRVEVNLNSPAEYLNEDRYAVRSVPAGVRPDAPPRWKAVGDDGRFEWHDHRAHWMGRGTPAVVKDEDVKTKVFDWRIPIRVGTTPGAISGTLYWTPVSGSATAIILGAAIVAACAGAVVVFNRRDRFAQPSESW